VQRQGGARRACGGGAGADVEPTANGVEYELALGFVQEVVPEVAVDDERLVGALGPPVELAAAAGQRDAIALTVHHEQRHGDSLERLVQPVDRPEQLFGGAGGRRVLINERVVLALAHDLLVAREFAQVEREDAGVRGEGGGGRGARRLPPGHVGGERGAAQHEAVGRGAPRQRVGGGDGAAHAVSEHEERRARLAPAHEGDVGGEIVDVVVERAHVRALARREAVPPQVEGVHGVPLEREPRGGVGVAAAVIFEAVHDDEGRARGAAGAPRLAHEGDSVFAREEAALVVDRRGHRPRRGQLGAARGRAGAAAEGGERDEGERDQAPELAARSGVDGRAGRRVGNGRRHRGKPPRLWFAPGRGRYRNSSGAVRRGAASRRSAAAKARAASRRGAAPEARAVDRGRGAVLQGGTGRARPGLR
jgi:hypothetical protein